MSGGSLAGLPGRSERLAARLGHLARLAQAQPEPLDSLFAQLAREGEDGAEMREHLTVLGARLLLDRAAAFPPAPANDFSRVLR